MKVVVLLLSCACLCAALSTSDPEARFQSVETETVQRFPASVLSDRAYAALKHEEAQKAINDLHLPGDHRDILSELNLKTEDQDELSEDASEDADTEILSLAAETETGAAEDEATETDDEALTNELESEIEAVEAEADSSDLVFLEEDDEAEDEVEDEDEDEDEDEAEEEEEEDPVFLEIDEEDADEEDMALLEEQGAPVRKYISPELRPAIPNKHKDTMPDKAYDQVAETNLFPGALPVDKNSKKKKVAPRPAVRGRKAGKRGKRSKRGKHAKRGKHGKHGKRGKHGKHGKHRKHGKRGKHGRRGKKSLKKDDPRSIITAPYLQDIRDARHKHLIKTTQELLNNVDEGLLKNGIHPPLADPNKKKCKKGKKLKKLKAKKNKKSKRAKKH